MSVTCLWTQTRVNKRKFVANSDRVQARTTGVLSMAVSCCHGERNEKAAPEEDKLALTPYSVWGDPEAHGRALPFLVETDIHLTGCNSTVF
jgi:hypothetical protein